MLCLFEKSCMPYHQYTLVGFIITSVSCCLKSNHIFGAHQTICGDKKLRQLFKKCRQREFFFKTGRFRMCIKTCGYLRG